MNILMVINYYYPYISGLSEVARQISEELVRKGNTVTVICSNHAKLKMEENINGVKVIRAPIIAKISKGTISLKFILWAIRLSKNSDIVNIHMPMLESGIISSLVGKGKCVATYQCDIDLPKGIFNNFIKGVMLKMNEWALGNVGKILVTSIDYGIHSKIAGKYKEKLFEVRAPIKDYGKVEIMRNESKKIIGFCGRIVMEKGIDVLIRAFKIVKERFPQCSLQIGGDYKNIAGGSIYPELVEIIRKQGINDVRFLGAIPEAEMQYFYSSIDVFVLPSINPLEAFGMVQVEAMYCGTPVVASDLYGVRTIIQNTGMGLIAKAGCPEDFAEKIIKVLENRKEYVKDSNFIRGMYSTEKCTNDYLLAYERTMHEE